MNAFKGIHSKPGRLSLLKVAMARHRAAADPANPYQLPKYRDPKARRAAREARRAANE